MKVNLIPIETKQVALEPLPEASWGETLVTGPAKSVFPAFGRGLGGLIQGLGEYGEQYPERPESNFGLGVGNLLKTEAEREAEIKRAKEFHRRVAEVGSETAKYWGEKVQEAQPYTEPGSAKYYAGAAAQSVAQMVPPLAAGIVTGNPLVTVSMMGGQVAGEQYATQREAGQTPETARIAAIGYGLAEAIPEAIPVGILLKPGVKLLTRAIKATATEIPQEMITEALQSAIDKGTIQPDMTWREAKERLIDAGIIAAISGPALAGITHPFVKEPLTKEAVETDTKKPKDVVLIPADDTIDEVEDTLIEGEKAKKEYKARRRAEKEAALPEADIVEEAPIQEETLPEEEIIEEAPVPVKLEPLTSAEPIKAIDEEVPESIAKPEASSRPRIVVEKARIVPTRAGVMAIPEGEREVYEGGELVNDEKKPSIGTVDNIDTVALSGVFKGEIDRGEKLNKLKVYKIIGDALDVKVSELKNSKDYNHKAVEEAFEYAIVKKGREIAQSNLSGSEKLNALKEVYENQPNLSQRTSTSIAGQQYSTPLPLAWLMGEHIGIDENTTVYEPTAGNGVLLIGATPEKVTTNELDAGARQRHLKDAGYGRVVEGDALLFLADYPELSSSFDRVIMNPPFGSATPKTYDGFRISKLEDQIVIGSLRAMKDDGRAAFIIGGHNFDGKGEMAEADRLFFNYLYSHYHVGHNIDISGNVYRKMGTSFPIRLVTIEGRKGAPDNEFAPYEPGQVERAETFDEVQNILARPLKRIKIEVKEEKDGEEREGDSPRPLGREGERVSGAEEEGRRRAKTSGRVEHAERTSAVDGERERPADRHSAANSIRPDGDRGVLGDGGVSQQIEGSEGVRPTRPSKRVPPEQSRLKNEFQALYRPASKGQTGKNLIPKNMRGAVSASLDRISTEKGDIDDYVMQSLGYDSVEAMHEALSAEQVDAVAMAINAIDLGKAVIVGDQTGVGKGRVAAATIRYANRLGKKPIFMTQQPKLFSDMFRDLADIKHKIKPFIMHSDKNVASIVDEEGNILFKPNGSAAVYRKMVDDPQSVMEEFDAIFVPYTQLSKENKQREILAALAVNNVVILDESHEVAGGSARGKFIRENILNSADGALYLSATYAKRPDTIPLYYRTSIGDSGMELDALIDAVQQGGVPLQQIMAGHLAEDGQYIRRELDFSGISIKTDIDFNNEASDVKKADEITGILRTIVEFDNFKSELIDAWDKKARKEGKKLTGDKHTSAGVNSSNFSSTVHNLVGQLLLSIKADNAVNTALRELKAGKKPLINLMNTMGSFIEDTATKESIEIGEPIGFTFRDVLKKALRGTLTYTVKDAYGRTTKKRLVPEEDFDAVTLSAYNRISEKIETLKTDVPASPIDYMLAKFEEAGYRAGEITGRKYIIDYSKKIPTLEKRAPKEIKDRNKPVNDFNSGKMDVLIFNRAGSTGLSLHASEKFKDQKPRHMIIVQADLNIDTFIQALGRIFRKGQVVNPEYTILQTALPAEIRPAVVLSKKMASLNANTSANSESATTMKDVPDMLNLYGDEVVKEYLKNNHEINNILGDPLKNDDEVDAMRKVTGRAALLPVELQKAFYSDVEAQYQDFVDYLNQIGENNLVTRDYDFGAKTIEKTHIYKGTDEGSPFSSSAWLEKVSVKLLKKPFMKGKIEEKVRERLKGQTADEFGKRLYDRIAKKTGGYREERKRKLETLSEGEQRVLKLRIGELNEQLGYILESLTKFKVADIYDVAVTDNFQTKGVLVDIRYDEKSSGSPAAPSKVKLVFAVADPIQTISLPLSKKLQLKATDSLSNDLFKEWDEIVPKSSREERHIITGNLLQGFERLGSRAEVITYTDDKGELRNGILLPKSLKNVEERFTHHTVDAEIAYEYLTKDHYRKALKTSNGILQIDYEAGGSSIEVSVPKAKKTGGKYYLNDKIRKLVRREDFISRGNRMWGTVEERDLKDFLKTLQEETGVRFEIPIESANKTGSSGISLSFLGTQSIYEATANLVRKLNPEVAPNVEVQSEVKQLGVIKKYLGSPGTIEGKSRYYVIHAKNAIHKQDRLRGLADRKLSEIFKPLKEKKLRREFEALEWMGDAAGEEYTATELKEMDVSPVVISAYLKHRKFHRQVWRLLSAHRKAYGGDTGYLKGHVPHLFENWNVYEVEEELLTKKGSDYEVEKTLGSILGTFRSLREATNFANGQGSKRKYVIRPKVFQMPDYLLQKTTLKDASFFKLVGRLEKGFELTREEALELTGEITRRKNRRRFFGNLVKRTGQSGFRKDGLYDILQHYYNSTARYVTLDDFKASVIPRFEKDFGIEHGRSRDAVRDKTQARYIERFIDDVGGVPSEIEEALNASIKNAPFLRQLVRSERPAIWGVNKLLHATAVMKLGVFNLSAGVVNLTQLTNTFAKVPAKHFALAIEEAMRPWNRMKPGHRAILKRIGVPFDLGLGDTGGYSVTHKGGKVIRASMFAFQAAEQLNRRVTGLASYRWARKDKGMNHRQAILFAREVIDKTQFDYSVADTAQIFRNPVGRLLGQFRPFAIKEIEFVTGLKGAENIKFWIPILLIAGLGGIPLIEGISGLIEWLTGKNPLVETKAFLMRWAGDDPQKKQAAEIAMYGVGSVINVDVSRRVGLGDVLPRRAEDLLGPTINTVRQALRIAKGGGDKSELVKTFAPSIGNLLTALETALNDMRVEDPWHRDRLKYIAKASEIAVKATGLRPVRESEMSDVERIRQYETRKYTKLQQRFIDLAIKALKEGDAEGFVEAISKAAKRGVVIDDKALEREVLQKALPQEIRTLLMTRKIQRGGQMELMEFLENDAN